MRYEAYLRKTMNSFTSSYSANQLTSSHPIEILTAGTQYRPCRIRVPDLEQDLAAVQVGEKFYSLVKVLKERQKAIGLAIKLKGRGDLSVITQVGSNYQIWVWEPEATFDSYVLTGEPSTDAPNLIFNPTRILESRDQYQTCHVRLPGMDERTPAILFQKQYYSLFKVVTDQQQAIEIEDRLTRKREKVVVTKIAKGYAIWVLEPDAKPA